MVSVIIPTLNEAELLPDTLKAIRANRTPHEILVIDGGSADETVAVATEAGSRVINSLRARRATQTANSREANPRSGEVGRRLILRPLTTRRGERPRPRVQQ